MDTSWSAPGAGVDLPRQPPATVEVPSDRTSIPLVGSPVDRLGPRRVGAILDAGFEVIRFRFSVIATITAVVVLPLTAVPVVIEFLRLDRIEPSFNPMAVIFGSGSPGLASMLNGLAPTVALALSGVVTSHLVMAWLAGRDPGVAELLRVGFSRWPVAIGAWLVVAPLKALGVVACGVGAVVPIAAMLVLSPVVGVEGRGVIGSVRRTWQLARRRLGPLVGLTCASIAVVVTFQLILEVVSAAVLRPLVEERVWRILLLEGSRVAFDLLMIPLQAAWAAFAYLDLRVRTEGLDLELETGRLFRSAR